MRRQPEDLFLYRGGDGGEKGTAAFSLSLS